MARIHVAPGIARAFLARLEANLARDAWRPGTPRRERLEALRESLEAEYVDGESDQPVGATPRLTALAR
jgi:hypothetical protein